MYARIVNNVVVELLKPLEGFRIEDCFHPDILSKAVQVAENTQVGDAYVVDPAPEVVVDPAPEVVVDPAPEVTPEV